MAFLLPVLQLLPHIFPANHCPFIFLTLKPVSQHNGRTLPPWVALSFHTLLRHLTHGLHGILFRFFLPQFQHCRLQLFSRF